MSMMRRPDMGVGPGRFTIEEIRSRIARRRAEEAIAQREAALELQSLRMKNESDTKEEILAERKKAAEERLKAEEQAAKEKAKAQGGEAKGKAKPLVQRTPINLQNAAATVETPDMAEMAAQGAAGGPAANQMVAQQSPVAGGNLQATGPEAGPTGGGLADIVNMLGGVPQNLTTYSERETVSPTQTPIGIVPLRTVTRDRQTRPNALSATDALTTMMAMQEQVATQRLTHLDRLATIAADPRMGSDAAKLLSREYLRLPAGERQQLEVMAAQKQADANLKKQYAVSAIGKLSQDLRSGNITQHEYDVALGALARGDTTSIQVVMPSTQAKISDAAWAGIANRDAIQMMMGQLTPEMTGYGARLKAWGVEVGTNAQGLPIIGGIVESLLPAGAQEELTNYKRAWSTASRNMVNNLRVASGTAVSVQEAERTKEYEVNIEDSWPTVQAKLQEASLMTNVMYGRIQHWHNAGEPQDMAPWQISIPKLGSTIDMYQKQALRELHAANPNVPLEQLAPQAIRVTEDHFNLMPGGAGQIMDAAGIR